MEELKGKSLKAYLLGCRDTEKEFLKLLKIILDNCKDDLLIEELKNAIKNME